MHEYAMEKSSHVKSDNEVNPKPFGSRGAAGSAAHNEQHPPLGSEDPPPPPVRGGGNSFSILLVR